MVLTIHNNNPLPICRRSYPPCPIPPNAALRESFTIETVYRPPSATQRPIFIVRHLPSAVRRPHHRPPLNHWLCCPCSFASLHLSSLIWPLCLQEHPSICWLLCCIITPITLLVVAFGLPSSRRIRLLVLCLPGALASSLSLHPFRSLVASLPISSCSSFSCLVVCFVSCGLQIPSHHCVPIICGCLNQINGRGCRSMVIGKILVLVPLLNATGTFWGTNVYFCPSNAPEFCSYAPPS